MSGRRARRARAAGGGRQLTGSLRRGRGSRAGGPGANKSFSAAGGRTLKHGRRRGPSPPKGAADAGDPWASPLTSAAAKPCARAPPERPPPPRRSGPGRRHARGLTLPESTSSCASSTPSGPGSRLIPRGALRGPMVVDRVTNPHCAVQWH